MKKTIIFLFAATLFTAVSCKKDDDNVSPNNVATYVSSGTWKVTYYWDSDHDETSDFTGYAFTFASGNTVTATKAGSATAAGTWSTGVDDSQTKLVLDFLTPAAFAKISDDWHVIESTSTRIKLEDVSGGSGETDYLTFEKN